MTLTDARRATRVDDEGRLLLLEEQDRTQWDRAAIDDGREMVVHALQGARPGRFVLQAVIAAIHAEAPTYETTDWPQLLRIYDLLLEAWPTPVVALNRAVALAMVDGPEAALTEVEALERDGRLTGYRYLPATKADLLRRIGRNAEAAVAYRAALALADNSAERNFLARRIDEVSSDGAGQQP
jgi:RNA polymerase sigma-70 factor (ECF subfamily)